MRHRKLSYIVIAFCFLLWLTQCSAFKGEPQTDLSWQLPEYHDTVSISPDAQILAVSVEPRESREIRGYSYGGRTFIELRKIADGSLIKKIEAFAASSIAISSDNSLMAVGTYHGDLMIWNLQTEELLHSITVPKEDLQYCINTRHNRPCRVSYLTFSPDDRYLASYTHNQGADVWNVANGQQLYRLDKGIPKITSDSKFVAFSGKPIVLHRIRDGKVAEKLGQKGSLILSPDGRLMAIYRRNFNKLYLHGTEDNPFRNNLTLAGRLEGWKFSPDSQYLAVATYVPSKGGGDFHVAFHTSSSSKSKAIVTVYRLLNSRNISQRTLLNIKGGTGLSSAAIGFTEDRLILAGYRGNVHLWNLEDLKFWRW